MSLIKKIETVFVKVENLEMAAAWYQRVLDVPVKWRNDKGNAIAFSLGETDLTLVKENKPLPLGDSTFNFFVTDIYNFHQKLEKENVEVGNIKNWFDLQYFSFKDLEGNHLQACFYKSI